jgi:hypothetical protein
MTEFAIVLQIEIALPNVLPRLNVRAAGGLSLRLDLNREKQK